MGKRFSSVLVLFMVVFLCLMHTPVAAEELDIVNRPVNIFGLTGLLFTTSPYTLPPGAVEIGLSTLSQDSVTPKYYMTEIPFNISVGMTKNSEIALRGSFYQIKGGPTNTTGFEKKTGDLELSYKWNFMPQPEYSIRPAIALIMAAVFPTEQNYDMKIDAVVHWGMRLGLSAGTEIRWSDHILGIYADVQMKAQDLSDNSLRDLYGIYNAGLLYPISKYRNLQILVEYTMIHGRERTNLVDGRDYSGLTYGIRLVSERFNLTMGTQFLNRETVGYDNSSRIIGSMSMKF